MPITIAFPQHETTRFNREYEAEQQTISRVEAARRICGIYAEKSESGKEQDGKKFVELLTGVLR